VPRVSEAAGSRAARFDALAYARTQLAVAIAQALVGVARSEDAEAEAHKLGEALAAAMKAVSAVGRRDRG
jgi:hypothetical protein